MQEIVTEQWIKQSEDKNTLNLYQKRNIVITKAKNSIIWDINGKQYIDCASGIGVANIGHSNIDVIRAICTQAENIITCPGIFYNDQRAKFVEKLINLTPDSLVKAFLCNSGTESIEAAIKFTRATTGKTDFICFNRSFHGRTLGSLSASFNKKHKENFYPLVEGFSHVPLNKFEQLLESITEDTAGIILELVQGEGGIHIADKDFVKSVRELCNKKNIILIIDEVQTGLGRTGSLFASQQYHIEPDILCLAKALGGGIPFGAVLCSNKIQIGVNKHGSTFGGNPLACAAGVATLDYIIDHKLDSEAKEKGDYLKKSLKKLNLPLIREIRGLGLMIGIELKVRVKKYVDKLLDLGIIVLVAGTTVIRLLPPLTITYEELDIVIEKVKNVLTEK